MNQELSTTVGRLIETYFTQLRRTVRKNLTRLTCAFLRLALSVRFGYGGLHLTSVARVLPQGVNFKSSYKWLSRFLKCKYFDPSSLAECMLALILGRKPPPWVIVLVDQTTIDGVQVVNAAIPLEGRAVPVAWIDFEYPWKTLAPASQNTIERYLLTWLAEAAPPHVRLLLVFDRGYARVELIKDLNRGQQPFLIRAPGKVIVQAMVRGRRQRMCIVHCFRDWKRHLGLRGLRLHVQKPERILRLLMGFTLAYLLLLLLGQDPLAEKLRPYFEQPRRRDRHGTPKILSVLSMALYLLSDPRWEQRTQERWIQILSRLVAGRGIATLSSFSP